MSKSNRLIYLHTLKYSNDIDLLDKIITIYSFVEFRDALTKQQRNVLRYYLNFGYSSLINKTILIDLKMKMSHLTQINFHLQKKGYLDRHATNHKEKVVSKNLINLKESFLTKDPEKKVSLYTISLVKE